MYHPQIVKIHGWNQKAVDVFRFFIHCMSLHLYGGTWGSLRVVSLHPMDLHWEIRCNFCPPTIAIQWSMIWFIQGNHFLHKQNGPSAIKWKDKCKCHSIKACKFGREHVQSARKRYILQKPPSLANNSFWTLLFSGGEQIPVPCGVRLGNIARNFTQMCYCKCVASWGKHMLWVYLHFWFKVL